MLVLGHELDRIHEASEAFDASANRPADALLECLPGAGASDKNDRDGLWIDRPHRHDADGRLEPFCRLNGLPRNGVWNHLDRRHPGSLADEGIRGEGRDGHALDLVDAEEAFRVDVNDTDSRGRQVHASGVGSGRRDGLPAYHSGDPLRSLVLVNISLVQAGHEDGIVAETPQELEGARVERAALPQHPTSTVVAHIVSQDSALGMVEGDGAEPHSVAEPTPFRTATISARVASAIS